jgi:predicted transcriptional regulator
MDLSRPFMTVTPTLDGDVLAVLASADTTFTTGQIHRVLNNFSDEGIRKVLSRLVVQGVVHTDRVGNAFAYRLNTEHLAAEAILALAQLRNTFLARLERRFDSWSPAPVYAAVFGSAATGTMSIGSDIDLFLVRDANTSDDAWARHVDDLVIDVTRWTGNDARVVEYTAGELRANRMEPLIRDVLDSGLTVAGSRAWFMKQVRTNRAVKAKP